MGTIFSSFRSKSADKKEPRFSKTIVSSSLSLKKIIGPYKVLILISPSPSRKSSCGVMPTFGSNPRNLIKKFFLSSDNLGRESNIKPSLSIKKQEEFSKLSLISEHQIPLVSLSLTKTESAEKPERVNSTD